MRVKKERTYAQVTISSNATPCDFLLPSESLLWRGARGALKTGAGEVPAPPAEGASRRQTPASKPISSPSIPIPSTVLGYRIRFQSRDVLFSVYDDTMLCARSWHSCCGYSLFSFVMKPLECAGPSSRTCGRFVKLQVPLPLQRSFSVDGTVMLKVTSRVRALNGRPKAQ